MTYLNLYNYVRNTGTGCFDEKLFELMNKADRNNYTRLAEAFPEQAEAWEGYYKNGLKWLKEKLNIS
jgi:hypothetical protein